MEAPGRDVHTDEHAPGEGSREPIRSGVTRDSTRGPGPSFTPGPWEWVNDNDYRTLVVADDPATAIIYAEGWWCQTPNLADACLIAAAPDLYRALERFAYPVHIHRPCPYCPEGHTRIVPPTDTDIDEARTALARARGDA